MILQALVDPARRQGGAMVANWSVLLMLGYAVFYLVRFFLPLLENASAGSFRADLNILERRVQADAESQAVLNPDEERRAQLEDEVQEGREVLHQTRVLATVAEGSGEPERAAVLSAQIPALEERARELREALRAVQYAARHSATDRLENLGSLRGGYGHPLVYQAVQQLAAQFPHGQYQRFEVSLLPAVSAFYERLSAARTMAGVFVLLGLLGTMVKLNGVVAGISAFTRNEQMQGTQFLSQMGALMQGISGAFTNSIIGVVLAVSMLVLIGHINAGIQRRVAMLDAVVALKVVPALAAIHHLHLPQLALGDILRGTGDQLELLNTTVVGLTQGMDQALNGLGRRIGEMLQQFGSYQKQYKQLNDWVDTLEGASTEMRVSAGELGRAAARIGEPIDEMNRVLRDHLQAQSEFQASGYLERMLADVRGSLEAGRQEQEASAVRVLGVSEDALRRSAAAAEAMLHGAEAQNKRIQEDLQGVAAALRATTGQQIGSAVARLAAITEGVGARLDQSAAAFARAAENLSAYGRAPTFFFWLTQVVWPAAIRILRRPPPPSGPGGPPPERRLSLPAEHGKVETRRVPP